MESEEVQMEILGLIAEQEAERKLGHYQPREPFVMASLDQYPKLVLGRAPGYSWTGCPVHGLGFMHSKPDGRNSCNECDRQRQEVRRRSRGIQPRNFCTHLGAFEKTLPGGRTYCGRCKSRACKAYRERKAELERTTGTP